jgi:uncharacterized damage-inducible protein DinB
MIPMLLKELEQEAQTTRKMLKLVPNDRYDWKPHEKSMTVKQLATHIAEIPTWIGMALNTRELDFANTPYRPEVINDTNALLDYFERSVTDGKTQLQAATEEQLGLPWTMRNGEEIYFTATKGEVIRMTYSQVVHHRAQLGVYLRLLNIPIPGSYGPSADELNS